MKIQLLYPHATVPAHATDGSVGYDLVALIENESGTIVLNHNQPTWISVGFSMELYPSVAALILPRSGLSTKHNITVANAPGLIDGDYRGEVKVCLLNRNIEPYTVTSGDRIAQMIITPVITGVLEVAETLSETERGSGGFGSTGV